MKRFLLFALLVATPAFAQSEEADAGDTSEVDRDVGPLRERIAPVSGHLFLKRGRVEVSPSVNLSLRDAFFVKYVFGGTLTWFPTETFGIGLRGGYSMPVIAGSAQICTFEETGSTAVGCAPPTWERLDGHAPGQIRMLGGVDLQWAPIYGKISLLAEQFLHFDLYAIGGVSAVQYAGPNPGGEGSLDALTFGGNVGGGMRFFLNKWIAVRTELRDLIYVEQLATRDRAGNPQSDLRHQLLFEVGVSFFIPNSFGEP